LLINFQRNDQDILEADGVQKNARLFT
jgi:hypothetical protein